MSFQQIVEAISRSVTPQQVARFGQPLLASSSDCAQPVPVGNMGEQIQNAEALFATLKTLTEQCKHSNFISEGTSFLSAKILIFCQILRDLQLRGLLAMMGKQSQGRVQQELVRKQILLKNLEPIEGKMEYQLNKMVRLADQRRVEGDQDPLLLKPRPQLLVDQRPKSGKYVPPKIQAQLPPQVVKSRKQTARQKRNQQYLRKKFLRKEQEQEDNVKGIGHKETAYQKRRRQYEQEQFVRLPQTKKDRSLKRQQKFAQYKDAEEGGMLGDIADLSEVKRVRKAFGFGQDEAEQPKLTKRIFKGKKGKLKKKKRRGNY